MNEQIKDVNPNAEEIASLEAQIGAIDITTLDPMDNGKVITQEVQKETIVQPETKVAEVTTETTVVTEDPIKTELERVKGQTQGKTPQEKFEYKLKLQLSQAKEMGIDIAELTGLKADQSENEDEDKPLTRKDLQEILKSNKPQSKSATEMAMEIENEAERELHLYYLDNKVNPNLTDAEKFQTAKDMVDSIKLKNQMGLTNIKPQVQNHSTASSFQPNQNANVDNQKLTAEENYILNDAQKRGIPLTKEDILDSRK